MNPIETIRTEVSPTIEEILDQDGASPAFYGLPREMKLLALEPLQAELVRRAEAKLRAGYEEPKTPDSKLSEWIERIQTMKMADDMLENPHLNLDARIHSWKTEARGSIWGTPAMQNFAELRSVRECLESVASGLYDVSVGPTVPSQPLNQFLGFMLSNKNVLM